MAQNSIIEQKNEYVEPLNSVNDEINLIIEQQNKAREYQLHYIEALKKYNNDSAPLGEFVGFRILGQDDKDHINVYWFKEKPDLVITIMHELGHAIGVGGHISEPWAIMYRANTGQKPVTQEDLNALYPHLKGRNLIQ